jgi:hypothetical protein
VPQQSRLPDAWLTTKDEHRGMALARLPDHCLNAALLDRAPNEHSAILRSSTESWGNPWGESSVSARTVIAPLDGVDKERLMGVKIQEPVTPVILVGFEDETSSQAGAGNVVSTHPDRSPLWWRQARRLAEPLAVVALVGAVFVAIELSRGQDMPAAPQATERPRVAQQASPGIPRQVVPAGAPRLIAPAAARPGDPITIVGYRNSTLCGSSEIRFDDTTLAHEIHSTATLHDNWVEMFMVMVVPSTATPGIHQIRLYGPVPGGRGGPLCGDTPSLHNELASVNIVIGP